MISRQQDLNFCPPRHVFSTCVVINNKLTSWPTFNEMSLLIVGQILNMMFDKNVAIFAAEVAVTMLYI